MSERDGSFRRLVQMVQSRRETPHGRPGRPPKNRVPTTGHFVSRLHNRMKEIADARARQEDHAVSVADLYNEAALVMITDLHTLLGDDLGLPAGAVALDGILGLRELLDRPVRTPLRDLALLSQDQKRTTLYVDQPVWDALLEMGLRFGLQLRQPIHVQRLLDLSAAWYLADFEFEDS